MNYTDGIFFPFFAVTFVLYYLVRQGHLQVLILVVASLFFYAWESPPLLFVFLCSWFITGLSSYAVLNSTDSRRTKVFATIGVVANLGLLGFFKYKFLFIPNVSELADLTSASIGPWLILAPLPIGISFYTFHGISLLMDVYRGDTGISVDRRGRVAKHLADTLLYLAFFPQLIAGPIIKAKDFYPQVRLKRFTDIDFAGSFRNLVLGYFLKSVVADGLSQQTFWIAFPAFQFKSSLDLLLLLYGYSAQIFADFAGYSLIAMGLAKLLGYQLPINFNFPYLASSVSEFWRRWHMSLSMWLRDYLYIPLGGSKKGLWRTYANLIVVMFLGGLWHGAAWSFAMWGLWHAAGLVIERPWLKSTFMSSGNPLVTCLRILVIFNFVTLGWMLFKLQEFSQAWMYLQTMLRSNVPGITNKGTVVFILVYGAAILIYHVLSLYRERMGRIWKDILYGVMLFLIITNHAPSTPFIYFQF